MNISREEQVGDRQDAVTHHNHGLAETSQPDLIIVSPYLGNPSEVSGYDKRTRKFGMEASGAESGSARTSKTKPLQSEANHGSSGALESD
jgi:hypothetical protein